ncbi:hypothetical protein E3N88_32880 [Mikania micrantha]|uniref:Transposase MuDR plant domain-containing protein n=1 Tax=Mikania micrantha TaxID=192012 RepID=A0A5N6M9T8_9ASTR|nr:hypothetical protein E3N88_32880 [Mikania micrantha]
MDLLRGFSSVNESPLGTMVPYQRFTESHVFEAGSSTNTNLHCLSNNEDDSNSDSEAEPPTSEESEVVPSSVETTDVDADEPEIDARFNSTNVSQTSNSGFNYANDPEELKAYAINESDDDDMEIWDQNYPARVGLGMFFRNKNDVMLGVRSWNINCGRELYVVESKSAKWRAKCYSQNPNCNTNFATGPPCSCKAWRARKEAIERIYGSWESNFEELPRYIAALQESNPGTIVEWFHSPTGSSQCYTFKYVFWAFGPAIKTFLNCQPILSVDGTHLM